MTNLLSKQIFESSVNLPCVRKDSRNKLKSILLRHTSRNVTFKTDVMSRAVLEAQASFVAPEVTDQEASSERCSLDDGDVKRNADLYVFNHEVAHG